MEKREQKAQGGLSHDGSYKALFSRKIMVRSLLRDFITDEFVKQFDLDTLAPWSTEYVSDNMQCRRNDVVWRLKFRGKWLYDIMLEFQSRPDKFMAVRMLTCTGLLWESLIKKGEAMGRSKLPPVFPIVLYNGKRRWNHAQDLSPLVESVHPALDAFQPVYKYRVLDEKPIPPELMEMAKGGAAYVFRAEQARHSNEIVRVAAEIDQDAAFQGHDHLREGAFAWLQRKYALLKPPAGADKEAREESEMQLLDIIKELKQPYIEEGRAEGEAKAMKDYLLARFGNISGAWHAMLDGIMQAGTLQQVAAPLYRANSPDEVEAILKNAK